MRIVEGEELVAMRARQNARAVVHERARDTVERRRAGEQRGKRVEEGRGAGGVHLLPALHVEEEVAVRVRPHVDGRRGGRVRVRFGRDVGRGLGARLGGTALAALVEVVLGRLLFACRRIISIELS